MENNFKELMVMLNQVGLNIQDSKVREFACVMTVAKEYIGKCQTAEQVKVLFESLKNARMEVLGY